MSTKSFFRAGAAFSVLLLLASCDFFKGLGVATHPSSGASFAASGSSIYCLGGSDDSDTLLDSALYAVLDSEGAIGPWASASALPTAMKDGSAFASGNILYYLGGRGAGGLSDAIYYTLVWQDGSLGFGSDLHWERNARSLPQPRANAALALHDGWVYLIGGTTPEGATASIIRARIWQDGQIGQWYECPETLGQALWGCSATVAGDRLYVAGGANISGPKKAFRSFGFGEYGSLADARSETELPIPLQKAVLASDGEDLILAGGWDADGPSSSVYRYEGGFWSDVGLSAEAAGSG
ncbi:MAG TPA: hypothetical protein VIO60_06115, partial [Rectinemataceae bacterium]